jgi:hypothetical protein
MCGKKGIFLVDAYKKMPNSSIFGVFLGEFSQRFSTHFAHASAFSFLTVIVVLSDSPVTLVGLQEL